MDVQLYSNTTYVNVKRNTVSKLSGAITIQIQPMLMLNGYTAFAI